MRLLFLLRVAAALGPTRRGALCGFCGAGAALAPAPARATRPTLAVLPLAPCGGGLAATYRVDGATFRGVVDTGSPFLLVDGTCGELRNGRWGCYPRGGLSAARGAQGALNDESIEGFGGQETLVEWRRGRVELGDRRLVVEPGVFGAIRSFKGRGGEGGVYLGLVKHRQPFIRPTFLEQTDAQSLRFDLDDARDRKLEISTGGPLIPRGADAVPMVDLRPLGAPVEPYAAVAARLLVNGEPVRLRRPVVVVFDTGTTLGGKQKYSTRLQYACIRTISTYFFHCMKRTRREKTIRPKISRIDIDLTEIERFEVFAGQGVPLVVSGTGTTGATVSDTLLGTDELPLPGAAIRCVEVVLKTERGRDVSLVARYRRGAEFPLIVTETSLPWFDKGNAYGRRRRVGLGADDDAPPHVVFIGLSFLERTRLTIDLEDRRLLAQVGRNPNGDPPPPKRFKDRSMYALADAAASGVG